MKKTSKNEKKIFPQGLTNKSVPLNWKASPKEVISHHNEKALKSVRMFPAIKPIGLKRKIRYAMGLFTMIRRPIVVKTYPVHIQLESTDSCNLHCTSCSRDIIIKKAKMLPKELWQKVIDELKPVNMNISGIGEPFLHPEIFSIVSYAKSAGAAVNCATNLTRVKGRHQSIVESGIDQLKVSIDATNPETYLLIRGENLWQNIIDDIRLINHWKKELKSDKPSIRFNFAVQQYNYEQIVDLVELANELEIKGIYFQFLSYVDMEDRKNMLTGNMSKTKLLKLLEEARLRTKSYGINTNLDLWERDFDQFWNKMQSIEEYKPNNRNCYMPWISTWLSADGWVRPCPIMPWTVDEGRMGHIGEQSFAEIWNNEKYRDLRAALKRGERPTRSCKTCYPQNFYNVVSIKSKLLP